jgi:hypothetical protein
MALFSFLNFSFMEKLFKIKELFNQDTPGTKIAKLTYKTYNKSRLRVIEGKNEITTHCNHLAHIRFGNWNDRTNLLFWKDGFSLCHKRMEYLIPDQNITLPQIFIPSFTLYPNNAQKCLFLTFCPFCQVNCHIF